MSFANRPWENKTISDITKKVERISRHNLMSYPSADSKRKRNLTKRRSLKSFPVHGWHI